MVRAKRGDVIIVAFSMLFVFSLLMIVSESQERMTGYAVSGTTVSNVTISKYLSISLSTNLSMGIYFGNVSTLPATNLNATHNFDTQGINQTSFWVNVSTDSNTNVDICTKADTNFRSSGGDTINLGNETYINATINNMSMPGPISSDIHYTSSYVYAGQNVSVGGADYFRFYMDIPAATPSGTYNNTVTFQGVQTGVACS